MTAIGLVLVGIAVAAIFALPYLEGVGAKALERHATRLLGVPTDCGELRLRPLLPGVELRDVTVATPGAKEGKPPAIAIGRVVATVAPEELFSGTPRLREVLLEEVTVRLRTSDEHGTNLAALAEAASDLGGDGLRIDQVRCTGGEVLVADNLLPGDGVNIPIEPFVLEEGESAPGVSAGKAVIAVLRELAAPVKGTADLGQKVLSGLSALVKGDD